MYPISWVWNRTAPSVGTNVILISDVKIVLWEPWMSLLNLTESAPFCVEVLWADHLVKKKHVATSLTDLHMGVWQYRTTQTGMKCWLSLLDTGFQFKACVRANLSDRFGTASSQPAMHLSNLAQLCSAVCNFNVWFVIYFLQIRYLTTISTLLKSKLLIWARTSQIKKSCVCTAQPLGGTEGLLPRYSRPSVNTGQLIATHPE